jgi:hypothetical protein
MRRKPISPRVQWAQATSELMREVRRRESIRNTQWHRAKSELLSMFDERRRWERGCVEYDFPAGPGAPSRRG